MHLDQSKNQESNHQIQFHVAFVCQILIIKCPLENYLLSIYLLLSKCP